MNDANACIHYNRKCNRHSIKKSMYEIRVNVSIYFFINNMYDSYPLINVILLKDISPINENRGFRLKCGNNYYG